MRVHFLALALVAVMLAGCFGDSGDTDEPGTTTTKTTTPGGGNTTTPGGNTTGGNVKPNLPPVLALRVLDDAGTPTTMTNVGGNLTFDATGSTDPDGSISDLAVIIYDGNRTRFGILVSAGQFSTSTFNFDRPGVVNVTVNAIDNRGGQASMQSNVYVNHPQSPPSFRLNAALEATADATACKSPTQGNDQVNPIENVGWKSFDFSIAPGATYVVAKVVAGEAEIAICSPKPNATALSNQADETGFVVTNADAVLTPANGTDSYFVSALSGAPAQDVAVQVVVHYEPRPAEVTEFM
jgi:hypothetical protein